MNHEKAIEEKAHKLFYTRGLGNIGLSELTSELRALVSTIQRAESDAKFYEAIGAFNGTLGEPKEVSTCTAPASIITTPSAQIAHSTEQASNAAPDVPSEGVPPAEGHGNCPDCNGPMSLVCDSTGNNDYLICFRCHDTPQPAASGTPEVDSVEYLAVANPPFRGVRGVREKMNGQRLVVASVFARDLAQRLRSSEAKRKETAKDFETAFRLVRNENDQLLSERDAALTETAAIQAQWDAAMGDLKTLEAERDAALARCAKLEDAFNKYGTHKDDCEIITVAMGARILDCTCGFDTALQP